MPVRKKDELCTVTTARGLIEAYDEQNVSRADAQKATAWSSQCYRTSR